MREVSLFHPMLTVFMWGVSLTHPVLPSLLCGEFFLHIRCCLHFYAGNFSYTSQAGFFSSSFFPFFYLGSFSYRSRESFSYTYCAGLMFSWGGFVTHPKRPSFMCGEFLLHTLYWLLFMQGVVLHIPCRHFFFFFFFLNWEVSLTHPMFVSFFFYSGEFLLHNPCWLHFYAGSFSYTSCAVLIFICGISLKHPVLLHFYLWSFSYTSHADIVFMWGVSLTHPMFLCWEFLLHIPR